MAQGKTIRNIGTEWINLSDEFNFVSGTTYYIQNRGPGIMVTQEPTSEPSNSIDDGDFWQPFDRLTYEVGDNDLYIRALTGKIDINISEKG